MIKTVSFAPPRAASSRSAAKAPASPRKTSPRAASGSPSPQIALEFSPLETPAPQVARKAPKTQAPKAEVAKVEAPKVPSAATKTAKAEVAAPKAAPAAPTTKAVTAKAPAAKTKAAKVEPAAPQAAPLAEAPAVAKPAATKTETGKLKGKRAYAPKDLAAQYGEKVVERPNAVPVLEAIAPKKRLSKVEREARRQLIKPDEGLRERLARATQITFKKPKSEPRGKGWKFECGRCGSTSYFQTPGGVCACGTIAVKELL